MDRRPHIIVVEDEATQRALLVDYLGKQNYRVSGADGGAAEVVLLDVGLPGDDGFVLARWLREKSNRIGIIMVTAASETIDRVVGLETGADDYIAKPFEPRELLARVRSVLRRATGTSDLTGQRVRMGRKVLDLDKRVLGRPGQRRGRDAGRERVRSAQGVRRESQPAAQPRLAASLTRTLSCASVGAILLEQNDEWAVQRARYMTLETIAPLSDDPTVNLPAIAG